MYAAAMVNNSPLMNSGAKNGAHEQSGWQHGPQHKQVVSAQPPGMGDLVPLCAYGQIKAEV